MATVEQRPATERSTNGEAGETPVHNPATGEVVGHVPQRSPEEVREARRTRPRGAARVGGARLRGARADPAARPEVDARQQRPAHRHDRLGDRQDLRGRPARRGLLRSLRLRLLGQERTRVPGRREASSRASVFVKGKKLIVRYAPAGVVGVIGPWNFPLTNSFGDCIPALAAGNTVILKPAEITPLTSLLMEEMLRDCGHPRGRLPGRHRQGLADRSGPDRRGRHRDVHRLDRGRQADHAPAPARRSRRSYLELGGKDPMIVLSDADVERAANAAAFYSMNNGGQVCISTERVYVEEPIYDEFVSRVTDKVRNLRQGSARRAGVGRRRCDDQSRPRWTSSRITSRTPSTRAPRS